MYVKRAYAKFTIADASGLLTYNIISICITYVVYNVHICMRFTLIHQPVSIVHVSSFLRVVPYANVCTYVCIHA